MLVNDFSNEGLFAIESVDTHDFLHICSRNLYTMLDWHSYTLRFMWKSCTFVAIFTELISYIPLSKNMGSDEITIAEHLEFF